MTDSRCRAWGAWWSLRRPPGAGYWAGVVTEPMPCRPVGFWNDPDGHRYRDSYFDLYPGVWRHGDWIKVTARGSCIIYGRSDSTLNRGGVRMGTAEFYRVVEDLPR